MLPREASMGETAFRLTEDDLERVVAAVERASPAVQRRARALLLAHQGRADDAIAAAVAAPAARVAAWRESYRVGGLARALRGRGRLRLDADARAARVRAALAEVAASEPFVTVRRVAERAGLPSTTTFRLMRELGVPAAPLADERPWGRFVGVGCGGAGARMVERFRASERLASLALEADADLARVGPRLRGASIVFALVGLGGATGSRLAPEVARLAREAGAVAVGVACRPFAVERARSARAREAEARLGEASDTLLVLEHDALLRHVPNLPMDQAFRVMDTLVSQTILDVVSTLAGPALLGLDEEEVRRAWRSGGRAMLLYGEGPPDARRLVADALGRAFGGGDPRSARGAVAQLSGGAGVSLELARLVAEELEGALGVEGLAIGARADAALGGRARLALILTGVTG